MIKNRSIIPPLLAASTAGLIYALSSTDMCPWTFAAHLALEGKSIWQPVVDYFSGDLIGMSVVAGALSTGFVFTLLYYHFGWRVASGFSLIYAFMPPIWYEVTTGGVLALKLFFVTGALVGLDLVISAIVVIYRRNHSSTVSAAVTKKSTWAEVVKWGVLILGIIFSIVSSVTHSYSRGTAANVYAEGLLECSRGKWLFSNGLVEDQLVYLVARRNYEVELVTVYPTNLVKRVAAAFPGDTRLTSAARVSPAAFARELSVVHPEKVDVVPRLEDWERRWKHWSAEFSNEIDDPFVMPGRSEFARELNAIARKRLFEGDNASAWKLFMRSFVEVCKPNTGALGNLHEMLRKGYHAPLNEENLVRRHFKEFISKQENQNELKAMKAAMNPKKSAERIAVAERRMLELMDCGRIDEAVNIARVLLGGKRPIVSAAANVVMGTAAGMDGDYASSELFLCQVVKAMEKPSAAVLNDYAETLRLLGKTEEAQHQIERCLALYGRNWRHLVTYAQILNDACKTEEFRRVFEELSKSVPADKLPAVKALFK